MSRNLLFMALAIVTALVFAAGLAAAGEAKAAAPGKPAPKAEAAEPEPNTDPATQTLEDRLRLAQRALELACADNQQTIPGSTDRLIQHLPNGSKDLINPETGKSIIMNPTMRNQHEMTIREPEKYITFYADADTPDKGRAVVYANGVVKYLAEKEFKRQLAEVKPVKLTVDERYNMREDRQSRMREERARRAEEAQKQSRQQQRK